jgi:hypothetical protein
MKGEELICLKKIVEVTCMVRGQTARRIGFDENSLRKCIRPPYFCQVALTMVKSVAVTLT